MVAETVRSTLSRHAAALDPRQRNLRVRKNVAATSRSQQNGTTAFIRPAAERSIRIAEAERYPPGGGG